MLDFIVPEKLSLTLTITGLAEALAAIPALDKKLTNLLQLSRLIFNQGEKLMSTVSDFNEKVTAHLNTIDAGIDGLSGDVAALKQQIADLQASETLSQGDKDQLAAISTRLGAVSDRVAALDALTPPTA